MYVPNPPPQPEYWVLSLSGGKDSTALGLEWLKRHQQDPVTYPLHEVIYCDTGMEFPAMVEHINRLEQIFTGAGIKFTRLKSEKSFEYLMFEYQPKKKNPELQHLKGKSWPTSKVRWCTGELKQKIVSRYFKQLRKQKTVIQLVALAADMYVVPATQYTTFIMGNGAISYEDIGAKVPYEMARDPKTKGGEDTLYMRQRKVFSPYGISYEKKSQTKLSPTDSDLENGQNWTLVHSGETTPSQRTYINHKAIPIARIQSLG